MKKSMMKCSPKIYSEGLNLKRSMSKVEYLAKQVITNSLGVTKIETYSCYKKTNSDCSITFPKGTQLGCILKWIYKSIKKICDYFVLFKKK